MHLLITNPDNLDLEDFVKWVMEDISVQAVSYKYRSRELEEVWNEYFQTTDLGWARDDFGKPIVPTVNYIINQFFDNLRIVVVGSGYDIITDQENSISGTDITIDLLATMMNYGTIDMPSYPYFEAMFERYADLLQSLYDEWVLTEGKMTIIKEEREEEEASDE